MTAEQFVALDTLRRGIAPAGTELDALAVADREEELADWLAAHEVERDWVIAPPFAAAGTGVDLFEQAAAGLRQSQLEPGLEWIASSLTVVGLLGEIREATHRVSELVAAVRSYSQLDRALVQPTSRHKQATAPQASPTPRRVPAGRPNPALRRFAQATGPGRTTARRSRRCSPAGYWSLPRRRRVAGVRRALEWVSSQDAVYHL